MSNKQSIYWHEYCLKNSLSYESQLKQDAEMAQQAYEKIKEKNKFYKLQIDEAKKRGLDGFDNEKLLVKRKKETIK